MLLQTFYIALGFFLLVKGADWLVNGASLLARKHRVPDLAVGLTIVAFGTSAPELVVNIIASVQNHQGIVFGNVIGSNNFNLFVILGISGLITPLVVRSSTVWREIPIAFGAVLLLFLFSNNFFVGHNAVLSRIEGLLLLGMFGLFLFNIYRQLKKDSQEYHEPTKPVSNLKLSGLILIGLALLVLGGRLVVLGAVAIASHFGVSEAIIGLTIVAAGTSLPELVTSVVAAFKKNLDIAVGNIIGSNIFNIFLILGVSSLIRPVEFEKSMNTDLALLGMGTLFLFIAMFTGKKKKLDRWEAAMLLLSFAGYTIYLIT